MMKSFLFLFALLMLFACNQPRQHAERETPQKVLTSNELPKPKKAKNVIFLIGDGMGLTQITAGLYSNGNRLNLEKFPVVGLHKNYASNNLITDSAAGATAFACGKKTYNGAVGVDPKKNPMPTILEIAEENGFSTGLLTTSTIVHATPASFIAHQPQRKMYEEIAADFLTTEIDIFIGGGKKFFDRREKDDRNLYKELEEKGYVVSDYFKEELDSIQIDPERNFAYFTADKDPLPKAQGREYLPTASKKAMNFLNEKAQKGFFLMIEGAQIDWGGHANNSDYIISEMLEFDEVVGAALEFAKNNKRTLVVVTADHETGGYAINPGSKMDSLVTGFTSDYHTATMVPVFAYGPGAEAFSGIYENTEIFYKFREAMRLD